MRNFFWSLSFICATFWTLIRIRRPDAIFHHTFFFVRYAPDMFFVNLTLVLFVWPFLINKGVIKSDYNNEGIFEQTKMYLVVYGLLAPSIFLFFIAAVTTQEALPPASLLLFFYSYVYVKKLLFFCRYKKQRDKTRDPN